LLKQTRTNSDKAISITAIKTNLIAPEIKLSFLTGYYNQKLLFQISYYQIMEKYRNGSLSESPLAKRPTASKLHQ
jgi:hypothetical protein